MKTMGIIFLILVFVLSLGCASSQDKEAKAKTKVHNERLKLIEDYKKCMKKAGSDNAKMEACDSYLKMAEALK